MEVVFYMRKFKVNVNGTSYTVEVAEEGVVAVAGLAHAHVGLGGERRARGLVDGPAV